MEKVFSDFEIQEAALKHSGAEQFVRDDCVGTLEEAMNIKTITKKCRGVVVKNRTRGDGTGELKLSMHMKWPLYVASFGMKQPDLVKGVYTYGQDSVHGEFAFVGKVVDEDGNVKYVAYPRLVASTGKAMHIENGAEEVAEIEVTCAILPDDFGTGVYVCMFDELEEGSEVATKWMTDFKPELVRVEEIEA